MLDYIAKDTMKIKIQNQNQTTYLTEYDNAGRPTIYKDQSMKWNGFDQLIQVGDQIQYAYDVNGIRKKK